MWVLGSVLAAICALVMAWVTRPRGNWSGGDAGRFCVAVILLPASMLNGMAAGSDSAELNHATQLLLQLTLYAGLPLLAAIVAAEQFGHFFSRLIWGRALLAICAVFALTRSGPYLHYWLFLVLAVALVGLLWGAWQRRSACWLATPIWCGLLIGYWQFNIVSHSALWFWLAGSLLLLTLVRRAPETAEGQP
ncbi:hypothetical protein CHH28_05790 [Bacterioplanes sanyensis]|uniref:Uncharacterized protein n=1 Tax=Bacterioplanes sanyensis TaxID=1249553 RepID=A0A222FGP0_9GAMM|nr:hypothetical protein [Bacterioplanes sanyensis]ASP38225.1 hypothetical protein CHH28_05790 [Bacterioplanes sanyensis]